MSPDYMVQYRCVVSGLVTNKRLMLPEEAAQLKRGVGQVQDPATPRDGARTRVG